MAHIRFTLKSPVVDVITASFANPVHAVRWRKGDLDFYEGRIWRVLCQMNKLDNEISSLLESFTSTVDPAYVSVQVKFYVISWSTLSDVTALLISEVFDLGTPPKCTRMSEVLANRHVICTDIPALFGAHKKRLQTRRYNELRNEVVHRSTLDEPRLHSIDRKITVQLARNILEGQECDSEMDAIFRQLSQYVVDKQNELKAHYQDTLQFLDQLMFLLAEQMKKQTNGS